MDISKILELIGANKLDEGTQKTVSENLTAAIEIAVKESVTAKLDEEKKVLVETYEKKFEDYKEDITAKFSNFVDTVLESELQIPDKVLTFAKKGELYDDLIEQFKVRLGVDQGLIDEEVKGLLKEAKEEILKLREETNKQIAENLEVKKDAQEMAAQLYLHEKCKGLTDAQKNHVFTILEGIYDKAEIDKKFDILKESEYFPAVEVGNEKGKEAIEKSKKKSDPKDNEDQVMEEEEKDKKEEDGKGKAEVEEEEEDEEKKKEEKVEESKSPFDAFKAQYLKVLKEGKI
jgi:hypothetical protein